MQSKNFFAALALILACSFGASAQTLLDAINDRTLDEESPESLSLFHDALRGVGMLDKVMGNKTNTLTVFAPNNGAIRQSPLFQMYMTGLNDRRWHYHLLASLNQHIVYGKNLSFSDIFDAQNTLLESYQDPITVNQFDLLLQNSKIVEQDVGTGNGYLHVVNRIIEPLFFNQPFAMLELQPEFGPDLDPRRRVALTDVADVAGNRDVLRQVRPEGTTFIGCRIRAFNRLEEYLPQTINYSPNVKYGEFMNESFAEETSYNFLEYMQVPGNYYRPDIPNYYVELVTPYPDCGHMWITMTNGELCFNNGCVVATPDPREFLASNGAGYVLDKCQVCPGVSMLTDFAGEKVVEYNVEDFAQYLRASEWNRRDLTQSVGDPNGNITLFASMRSGIVEFFRQDTTRISTDKWKAHLRDLLRHCMVQGAMSYDDLKKRYDEVGPYNLTSLALQPIEVDYDSEKDSVLVAGGMIAKSDIRGVDGLVHFTTKLPAPISVTHTVYDIANVDPQFGTQVLYIDTVYLDSDMKRLLPLTAMYAPNEVWNGKKFDMELIGEDLLKSFIFNELRWCDVLREEVGTTLFSLNKKRWNVTINDDNMPCFETLEQYLPELMPQRACITKCDILARNGIVHELDFLMLSEIPETRPPTLFDASAPIPVTPRAPVVFANPVPQPIMAPTTDSVTIGSGSRVVQAFLALVLAIAVTWVV